MADQLPILDPDCVVALGPRDAVELAASGINSLAPEIRLLTDLDLRARAAAATNVAIDRLAALGLPWWLHVDLDVLSSAAMPAVDYPQPGGLSWPDLTDITAAALRPRCIGMTPAIYNPNLDDDGRHAHIIVGYLAGVLADIPAG